MYFSYRRSNLDLSRNYTSYFKVVAPLQYVLQSGTGQQSRLQSSSNYNLSRKIARAIRLGQPLVFTSTELRTRPSKRQSKLPNEKVFGRRMLPLFVTSGKLLQAFRFPHYSMYLPQISENVKDAHVHDGRSMRMVHRSSATESDDMCDMLLCREDEQ